MATLICRKAIPQMRLLYQVRRDGHWNRDWQPGEFPDTCEKHAAAAEKYNLIPEEYKAYPKGSGYEEIGDYPKLPAISNENKDVYYPWDLPDERRNFGEPLHIHAVWFREDRCDTHAFQKQKYSPLQMFLGLLAGCLIICLPGLFEKTFFAPVAKRHCPRPGVKNYTYDPVE